jgi:hypothetical protein
MPNRCHGWRCPSSGAPACDALRSRSARGAPDPACGRAAPLRRQEQRQVRAVGQHRDRGPKSSSQTAECSPRSTVRPGVGLRLAASGRRRRPVQRVTGCDQCNE